MQPAKALAHISVVLDGIIICFSEIQLEKASSPIILTPFWIITDFKEVQPQKA